MAFQAVTNIDALWSGEMTACSVDGQPVLLVNIDGEIRAYADICPHMRTPLSKGALNAESLTCATHGWVFNVLTGCGINPTEACLTSFAAVVEGNQILVDVDQPSRTQSSCLSAEESA
jgi:toluene monooxygenase system ferredoxin subunit